MCGKGEKTTTQKTELPPEVKAQYAYLMDRANQVAETPYEAYGGQRVAGLVPAQYEAMGMMRNAATAAQNPMYWSGQNIQQYMSPYTQNVIDTTLANTNQADQLQQQQIIGNAIKQGNAFGGDRMGLAQAELARNQALARNQTVAGLWNQNWTQANDNFARQQQYGLQANEAASKLATQYLGAGSLAQATQQKELDALYEAYTNRVAFPYQQLGWLGNLSLGVGGQSGGTTTKTESGGSPFGQIFGGAMALGSMFMSDEDSKENIREIGTTHDGQPIHAFNYKGDPRTQIGLIAQEVEQTHPEAVARGDDGLLRVDYDLATRDAAEGGEYAAGGAIPGLGQARIGLIPDIQFGGRGLNLPGISDSKPEPQTNWSAVAKDAERFGNQVRDRFGSSSAPAGPPMDIRPEPQASAPMDPLAGLAAVGDGAGVLSGLGGLFAFGGPVGFGGSQWAQNSGRAPQQSGMTQGLPFGSSAAAVRSPGLLSGGQYQTGGMNPGTAGMPDNGILRGPFQTGGPMRPNGEFQTGGPMQPEAPPTSAPFPTFDQVTVGQPGLWSNMYSWLQQTASPYTGGTGNNPFANSSRPTWAEGSTTPGRSAATGPATSDYVQPWGYASGGAVEDLPAPDLGSLALDEAPVGLLPFVQPPREMLERPAPRAELPPLPEGRVPERPEPRAADATPPAPRPAGRGSASSFDIADRSQPSHWRALLRTIAGPESGGRYNVRFNGTPQGATFDDYSQHPNVAERIPEGMGFTQPGRRSSAAGAYQFTGSTWATLPEEIRRGGFSPENQDRAARWLATERYRQQVGRDLDADLQQYGLTPGMVRALGPTWEAFARGRPEEFVSRYSQLVGQPAGAGPGREGGSPEMAALRSLDRPDTVSGSDGRTAPAARPREVTRLPRFGQGLLDSLGISLSDDARHGMLAAGLGMMASRSRNPLTQIGEGGLAGLSAYRENIGMQRQNDLARAQIADLQSHSQQRQAETALKQRQLQMQERAEGMFSQLFGGNFAPGAPPPSGPSAAAVPAAPSASVPSAGAAGAGAGAGATPPSGTAPTGATSAAARDRGDEIDPSWDPRILAQAARVAAARGMEGYAKSFNEQLQRISQSGMVYNRRGELVPLPGYAETAARQAELKRAGERQAENDMGPRTDPATGATVVPSTRRGATAPAPAAPTAAPQPSSAPPAPAQAAPATPVAPAPAAPPAAPPAPPPLPAAVRLSGRAEIEPRTARVQTVVPPPPPGSAGGYPQVPMQEGEYLSGLGPLDTKRRENDAAAEAEVSEKALQSGTVQQQLMAVGQAFKLFGSNTITDRLMGASQIAAALGFNQEAQRMVRGARADAGAEQRADGVAAMEWLEKEGNDLALNILKAANSRFTQAEFMTFSQRGVPTRGMRPETAHNLLASQMGMMDANRKMQEDWLAARQQGWQSISAFADAWKRANPTQMFIDAASRRLGNFRGMPVPPLDRWAEGATYVVPDRITDPKQREVLESRGIRPGQTFRYLGRGRTEIVKPEDAFTAHLRQ